MKVNKKFLIIVAIFTVLVSSCTVISFYPLYTEDVLINNDNILGKWVTVDEFGPDSKGMDTLVWEITFNDEKLVNKYNALFERGEKKEPNKYTYSLFLYHSSSPEVKTEFQLHLVDLNGETYIDFFPEEWNPQNMIIGFHLIGVHTFAKVKICDDEIVINWFDSEWFAKKLEDSKVRIKHERNSADILLTAHPKELQKFVIKYSNDENAFTDSEFILKSR